MCLISQGLFFSHNAEIGQVSEPTRLRKDSFRSGTILFYFVIKICSKNLSKFQVVPFLIVWAIIKLNRNQIVSERKLLFFVKVKEDQNFNRRNTFLC